MAVRPVVRMPAPALKRPAAAVGRVDERALALARDLVDTMRAFDHCVGLAAPQIGVPRRALVVDVTGHRKTRSSHGLIVLFDPELVRAADPEVAREGCMSVPDLTGDVARPASVAVRGRTPEGGGRLVEADAFEARALLHELDHLDGLLFLDRVGSVHRDLFRRRRYR
ncbi:MAG TPA: peptide deformylase [Actinomycetes bacterium]|nr:peptide deformylase [Actinomycetes bacterium]